MQLTQAHIDELFSFVEGKGIKPFDLQIELVDHLATDIEQVQVLTPTLSFEEALQQVYAKFGRWGFDYLLQKAERNAQKRQEELFWKYFSDFFRWPKAFFTAILALVIWYGYESGWLGSQSCEEWWIAIATIFAVYILYSFYRYYRYKNLPTIAKPPFWFSSLAQIPTWLHFFLGSSAEKFLAKGYPT